MKKCFKCGTVKPISEFYRHPRMADGHLGKCKTCAKFDVRQNYLSHHDRYRKYEHDRFKKGKRKAQLLACQRRRRKLYPEKNRANLTVRRAIRAGRILRLPCAVCGALRVEAHHDDYFKPLEVKWLCFKHHREMHGQTITTDDRNIPAAPLPLPARDIGAIT